MDSYDNELERLQAGEFENIQPPKRRLKQYILSHKDIIKKDMPAVEYLLAQWLPLQSLGMVYAKPAVGKSWFCMALVLLVIGVINIWKKAANGSKQTFKT